MIVVHHLNESRSQRILWLLEELGQPYDIRPYQRNATTRLAPPELQAVHPLGKSPVLEDGGVQLIESGAIVDYLIRHYGNGPLRPAQNAPDFERYQQWLHYAEGSAMLPTSVTRAVFSPLMPTIRYEMLVSSTVTMSIRMANVTSTVPRRSPRVSRMLTCRRHCGSLASDATCSALNPNAAARSCNR